MAAVPRAYVRPPPAFPCPNPQKTDQLCKNPKPCSYGDRCIFAHNMEEQKRFRQAFGTGGASAPAAKAAQQVRAVGAGAGGRAGAGWKMEGAGTS